MILKHDRRGRNRAAQQCAQAPSEMLFLFADIAPCRESVFWSDCSETGVAIGSGMSLQWRGTFAAPVFVMGQHFGTLLRLFRRLSSPRLDIRACGPFEGRTHPKSTFSGNEMMVTR
jgi:hypothetical protein